MKTDFILICVLALILSSPQASHAQQVSRSLKYGDGKADGKKSLAGTGEMIEFELPNETQQLQGLRIHGSRYGHPKAPDEEIEMTIVSDDETQVIHTELVPYSTFKRGDSRWTMVKFAEAIDVPKKFWVILDFDAQQTKGVYVSFDTDTKGAHSKTGLPGSASKAVTTGGDWMVQCILTKPESDS